MTTKKSVLIADVLSRACITTGGIGTIVAVLGVCVFLVWVVMPLFHGARVEAPHSMDAGDIGPVVTHTMMDDYLTTGALFGPQGELRTFTLDDGRPLSNERLFENVGVTAFSFRTGRSQVVYGLSDDSLAIVDLRFKTAFLASDAAPPQAQRDLAALPAGGYVPYEGGVLQLTPENQYRTLKMHADIVTRITQPHGTPVAVSHAVTTDGMVIAYAVDSGNGARLFGILARNVEDMMTGEERLEVSDPVSLPLPGSSVAPDYLAVSSSGQDIYAAWRNGRVTRLRAATLDQAFVAETGRLVPDDANVTAVQFALGGATLMWGDSKGRVFGGFPVRLDVFEGPALPESACDPRATFRLALTKHLGRQETAPVLALVPCARSRLMFVGYEDGGVAVYNTTSEARLVRTTLPSGHPVKRLAIAPREDGILALDQEGLHFFHFDPMYTEADFNSLFRPIWYEGYPAPMHMWQSSSASDDFEPKMGLMPLIFGTLKATFYAMLFGAPIALLAAIFSSEFLHPRIKAVVKPAVEMMASLPSVVLGFLGALVFAPFVEQVVPAVMLFVPSLFACLLLGAYLWQTLPVGFTRLYSGWRIVFMVLPVLLSVVVCRYAGPIMEKYLFAGDIKGWLAWQPGADGDAGSPFAGAIGGWALLLSPLSILIVTLVVNRLVTPAMRRAFTDSPRGRVAWAEVVKFLLATAATLLLALGMGAVLNGLSLDPRLDFIFMHTDMSPMDIYVQRNALIVGVVMGFAVIPIVYTIGDDALAAVPDHLRSASLGCGATTWQTAIRIVIPTAMSGLFSALMIGLGRAVGETMIVLMALGNTAIMDWNIFNGARTLSANIAVELPEAVRNSAHYRTLFLAGLVLFAMTFVVNTVAESVRLRFRKRAYQL